MDALDLITKRLKGNRGLAEEAIHLIEKYADFDMIESEFAYEPNETYWKEVCQGEVSEWDDRLTDYDYYAYSALKEYFTNIENSTILSGLGDCLFLYMKSKKGLNENMKSKSYKRTVNINESQLRKEISRVICEMMGEKFLNVTYPPGYADRKGDEWKASRIKKAAEENPDLDPNGFSWIGNTLSHNGKMRSKAAPREKIARREGESTEEYLNRGASKSPKVAQMLDHEKNQEFRNIENILNRFGIHTQDYLDYQVSELGNIRIINNSDVEGSIEPKQYQDKHGDRLGDYQVHLGSQNCPVVKNLVAFAFPDIVKAPFSIEDFTSIANLPYVVVHKDGKKENNAAVNLEWVPKRRGRM